VKDERADHHGETGESPDDLRAPAHADEYRVRTGCLPPV
jgi:hypothetical protein